MDEFDSLVGKIYEAGLDPSRWNYVLVRMNRVFRTPSASLFYNDVRNERHCPVSFHNGMTSGFFDAFRTYYSQLSPTYQMAIGREGTQRVITTPMAISRTAYEASEYFNDFFRPHRFRDVLVVSFPRSSRHVGVLAFRGDLDREPFSTADIDLLERLWPHVRMACDVGAKMREFESIRMASLDALDTFSHGVVMLDGDNAVVHCNEEARRIIDLGDGMVLRGKTLVCLGARSRRMFDAALKSSLPGGTIGMPRPIRIDRTRGDVHYIGWMVSVRNRGDEMGPGIVERVLVLSDPVRPNACCGPVLQELYGLTPHEAQIAIALGQGLDAQAIATSRGVSINTVRTQRARIYAKLGVENQAQLARLVAALPQFLSFSEG
ncbi:MAG TPA: helix-turn-helix transcriptional regulator [Luteibacter sp.]|jgi:DNA-binding CsgD family transcriptional regulator/PAS domain-containing protein|nr:helix-turn-helix transcriptional regulator [Luteibacter sp.]